MNIITLDFESFFGDDYTLSKMSTEAYIRDSRFEAHGCAIKARPDLPARWWPGPELKHVFADIDFKNQGVLCHHAQFDGLILSHHYGVHPKMWFDTLAMARLLLGNHLSVSLDSVRKHFGIPLKTTPYNLFRNKRWHELDPSVQQQIGDGAIDEVESIWRLFCEMGKSFPRVEYEVVDITTKMFTEPVLQGNIQVLADLWMSEENKKQTKMQTLGVTEADLQSADRFAQLLRDRGVEPEMKDGKNGPIYAFAKTDDFMRDLLEDEDEEVRTLAEARLGVKSTILQTRAETFGFMARRGALPVYLRYAGAGTLRPSGGDGSNFLNMKRRSPIRKSIEAPDRYLLGPVDASQIECRVLHYLAGGPDEPVIQKFRAKEDPYVDLASRFYGEAIYKPKDDDPRKEEMEAKRGMGKQGRLMCGYGAAGPQFKKTAKNGLYGPPIDIPLDDCNNFVRIYRETNPSICDKNYGYWAQANKMLARLDDRSENLRWGPLTIHNKRIYLPEGQPLIYDTLEWYKPGPDEAHLYKEFERKGFWRVRTRQGWKTMWGSKLVQNICEAVARVIVTDAMIRCYRMGYRALNHPYDELLFLIPDDGHAPEHLERCRQEMMKAPAWLPDLPLDAEGSLGKAYSK